MRVSLKTVFERSKRAIKLGIAINPFNVSATAQTIPLSPATEPITTTETHTNLKGIIALVPNRYSVHRSPYKLHPSTVVNANKTRPTRTIDPLPAIPLLKAVIERLQAAS